MHNYPESSPYSLQYSIGMDLNGNGLYKQTIFLYRVGESNPSFIRERDAS